MKSPLKARLSFLFFMQYAVNGAIFPVIALYLREYLGFSGIQTGAVLATSSLSALVSPLLWAVVADKYVSTERLFGICHAAGALLMLVLAFTVAFPPFLVLYFFFGLFFGPTAALANAIVFHHVPEGETQFGGMRLWGTVGWIVVSAGFSLIWLRKGGPLRGALILAGIVGLLLALFTFLALPRGEKRAAARITLFPVDALRVFARRDILLLSIATLLYITGEKIYYFGTALYLRSLALPESGIMPFMSIAQITEIGAMILLSRVLRRWRAKRVLAAGMAFLVVKFLFLALGPPILLAGIGIAFHGPSFTFFMITVFIYLDRHCQQEYRTGVHQIFNIIEAGAANLLGNLGAGLLMDRFTLPGGAVSFSSFWMVPGIGALVLFLLIVFFFPRPRQGVNS